MEYVIAFAVILEAMRYSVVNDARLSRKTFGTLAIFAVLFMAGAALLVLYPDISIKTLPGLAITLERSIELLRCGVLLFIWVFATRLGISWRHHVWGIVFGLGIYSGFSLLVAAIHATTGTLCGDWLLVSSPSAISLPRSFGPFISGNLSRSAVRSPLNIYH
ncbi:MAG TPA: hypothetical protein VFR24_12125 [Candidatus Angelobacter sp.]|nr:hypothetical protein [Candidatus Angelobacter sp.]